MIDSVKSVRVRFAPSPTGHLHLGGARTALFNYLIARKTGGQFIIRIEDTDRKRLVEGAEEEIYNGLRWLGMDWNEGADVGGEYGPYRQSERKDIYLQHAQILIEKGNAYPCFCSAERLEKLRQEQQKRKETTHYDGTCLRLSQDEVRQRISNGERHVIRFKCPKEGSTVIRDLLRGDVEVDNGTLDDIILVKSDGLALYHLAAMVDDHLMKITHVIRGAEWLSTFAYHSLIHRAFGWQEPVWVHLSIFLKPSGKGKMSKRETADLMKDGHSIFIKDMRGLGYLPEGVVNWIALMGWSYDDHTEFFGMQDLIEKFDLNRLNPSPAAINFAKLDHFNSLQIRNLTIPDLATRIKPFFEAKGYAVDDQRLIKIAPLLQVRLTTLDEAVDFAGFFFEADVQPTASELVAKGLTAKQSVDALRRAYDVLKDLSDMKYETTEPVMRALVGELGLNIGQLFGILRVAVTGQTVSPPLFESMEIVGRETSLQRIRNALAMLEKLAADEK